MIPPFSLSMLKDQLQDMLLEATNSSSSVQKHLSALKPGDVIEATVVGRDAAADLLDYGGQNLRASSHLDLPTGARVRLRVTKAATPLEVKLEAVIPDEKGPGQSRTERAIVRLQASFSRLKGLMEGLSKQTQTNGEGRTAAGKTISRPEGFLKAFSVSGSSTPEDIKAMTFFLSKEGSGLLKMAQVNPEAGVAPDSLSSAAGREGSGTEPAGKAHENQPLKVSSGRAAVSKDVQSTGGKSGAEARVPHREVKNPGRLPAGGLKESLQAEKEGLFKVNQDAAPPRPERSIPGPASAADKTTVTKGPGVRENDIVGVDAGRRISAADTDGQQEKLTPGSRNAFSSGLRPGEQVPEPHSPPRGLNNNGSGSERKNPVPSEDAGQQGSTMNLKDAPPQSSKTESGLFRRIFSSGMEQISPAERKMEDLTVKAGSGQAVSGPDRDAKQNPEPAAVPRTSLEQGHGDETAPVRGSDVSAGQDKTGIGTDLKTRDRISEDGKLRQDLQEEQPVTSDKTASAPSRNTGSTVVREFSSHVELAGQIQHHLLKETGQNLFIFPFLFSDMEGTGQWSFWKEDSREQSPEGLSANAYHITFDLYLKSLGQLNIHIFNNEGKLGLFIAAREEMLPVIRQGLSDVTARIKALGYRFETISCFSLEDEQAPELSSLPFDPGKGGSRFHFVT